MKNETDVKKIKELTKQIARAVPIKKENNFGIAIHPFTNTVYWNNKMLEDMSTEIDNYDLSKPNIYNEWCKEFDEIVDKCDNLINVYMLWREPWKLTFMKYCGEYLSEKDYAEYLADAWVIEENPNMDANVPIKESVKMFKSCNKNYLMTEEDLKYWKELKKEVVLYRGVSKGRIKLGLSWTDDKEMAIWFMKRWDDRKNCLLKVKADKKDIIAYFNTRNEKECLLDVMKYKNKIKEIHKI